MLIIVFISHENLQNFGNLCDHLTAFGFLSPETCFTYCFIKKNKIKPMKKIDQKYKYGISFYSISSKEKKIASETH